MRLQLPLQDLFRPKIVRGGSTIQVSPEDAAPLVGQDGFEQVA